jgi:hypothetical protein
MDDGQGNLILSYDPVGVEPEVEDVPEEEPEEEGPNVDDYGQEDEEVDDHDVQESNRKWKSMQ